MVVVALMGVVGVTSIQALGTSQKRLETVYSGTVKSMVALDAMVERMDQLSPNLYAVAIAQGDTATEAALARMTADDQADDQAQDRATAVYAAGDIPDPGLLATLRQNVRAYRSARTQATAIASKPYLTSADYEDLSEALAGPIAVRTTTALETAAGRTT